MTLGRAGPSPSSQVPKKTRGAMAMPTWIITYGTGTKEVEGASLEYEGENLVVRDEGNDIVFSCPAKSVRETEKKRTR